jgi:Tfp pilus assembly ATPase PilU
MERDQASKFVNDLLRLMVSRQGSDLFLTADFPPGDQGRRQGHQGLAAAAHRASTRWR